MTEDAILLPWFSDLLYTKHNYNLTFVHLT